jgi:hypothetical protein
MIPPAMPGASTAAPGGASTAGAEKPFPTADEKDAIRGLLVGQRYAEAEQAIAALLSAREPTLTLYIWRDIALNGQRKNAEADKLKPDLLEHWNRYYKRSWLERDRPRGENSWPRLEIYGGEHPIQICEYFVPEITTPRGAPPITSYYKFIIRDRDGNFKRLYRLDMLNPKDPFFALHEAVDGGARIVKGYGAWKPNIWDVLKDVHADMEKPEKSGLP